MADATEDAEERLEAERYRREFYIMSVAFGLNHATVTTPILYAASVLTKANGNASNALLYGATLVCSLFLSNLLYAVVGSKNGLTLSMALYTVYVGLFALSTSHCKAWDSSGSCVAAGPSQLALAGIGSLLGGMGAGVLWTCQGAFYAMVCERLARAERRAAEQVTAECAGTFGAIFLGFECAVRAITSLLKDERYGGLRYETTFLIWTVVAFSSTLFFALSATNLQPPSPVQKGSMCDKLLTAVRLWRDPALWLLQLTNLSFGFAAAWLSGYVGPNILSLALNSSFIGFAGALLSGFAGMLSQLLGAVGAAVGKGPVLALGSLAFLALGIMSKWVGQPAMWGWGATVFYLLMGIGRAVYESTNKAIIADFFPKSKGPGAFANVFVFGTASSVVAFILGALDTTTPELYLLLVFAALTVPSFFLACFLRSAESRGHSA